MHQYSEPIAAGGMERYMPLIEAADGLTLGQVCSLTGLSGTAIQNWVKRGFVSRPVGKKYRSRQLARILLINALRDCMKLENIGELMSMVNGDANDTGDDIISEEQLYDYLCALTAASRSKTPGFEEISALVEEVTADYVPNREDALQRLRNALSVMTLAMIAGRYKQEADVKFGKMKENTYGDKCNQEKN